MKTLALALSLGAALAAPLAASAQAPQENPSLGIGTFLIVDSLSGRTLATLVPVRGRAHELRLIGVATSQAGVSPESAAETSAASPLTPELLERARRTAQNEEFYAPPDAGSRGW